MTPTLPPDLGRYLGPAPDQPLLLDFTGGSVRLDRMWLDARRAVDPDLGRHQLVREADHVEAEVLDGLLVGFRPWRPACPGDSPPTDVRRAERTWIADGPTWQLLLRQLADGPAHTEPAGRLLTPDHAETHLGVSRRRVRELLKRTTGTEPGAPHDIAGDHATRRHWRWRSVDEIERWYAAMTRAPSRPQPVRAAPPPPRSARRPTSPAEPASPPTASPDRRLRTPQGEVDLLAEALREG